MRILPVLFFLAFHRVCLFSSGDCKEGSIRDENPEHSKPKEENSSGQVRLVPSKEEPVAYGTATDQLPSFLRKNLKQGSTLVKIGLKNRRRRGSARDKHATFEEEVPLAASARPAIARGSVRQISSRKLNRRSAQAAETKKEEQATRESGFSSGDRGEDQHSRERVGAGGFRGEAEEERSNYGPRFDNDQRPVNLSDLLKNGFLEMVGLPGQAVKKILGCLLDAVRLGPRSKAENRADNGLPGTLFEKARDALNNTKDNAETSKVGIHKAVKVGPLSVKLDVGTR